MYTGSLVFNQVMDFMPLKTFKRCVEKYNGNFSVKHFSCLDQFRIMAFAQLTYRESLRDIEACLRAQSNKLYHMGIRSSVSRSTLAEANEMRNWRIYADFAHHLIGVARKLYQKEPLAVELKNTVYALDATTIDLCLSIFPFPVTSHHHLSALQTTLAGGALFQMDQTESTNQKILRHFRKRREDSDLDRCFRLSDRGDNQKATQFAGKSLHNFTGPEHFLI